MRTVCILLLVLPLCRGALALEILRGTVSSVRNGDNLTLSSADKTHRVRLAEIDAPEKDQQFARESTEALIGLALGQHVEVIVIHKDRKDRLVGRVFAGQVDVNAEMVRQGFAWVDPRTVRDPVLIELEKIARKEKRGLWQSPHAIPPWEWRQGKRRARRHQNRPTSVALPLFNRAGGNWISWLPVVDGNPQFVLDE